MPSSLLSRVLRPEFLWRPNQFVDAIGQKFFRGPEHETERTLPWGHRVYVDPSEFIGRCIVRYGVVALEACEVVWRLAAPGDFVVDVGANIGVVSSAMAKCVGSGGQVLAVEMMPETFQKLKSNVGRWGSEGTVVQCVNVALSDRVGQVTVGLSDDFRRNKGVAFVSHHPIPPDCEPLHVPSTTLDQLTLSREIAVLKIDVERHEAQVLIGAKKLLETGSVRHIVFEDWEVAATPAKKLLVDAGYSIWCLRASCSGLRLVVPPDENRRVHVDCLATLDPKFARGAFGKLGYRALRPPSRARS